MNNIFMAPFAYRDNEKLASAGPNPVAQALISGDPDTIAQMMSEQDHAFFKLSSATMEKMASGVPLTDPEEIDKMAEAEIAALTLLGEDAMFKVAAYLEFYQEVARNEEAGRDFARSLWAHQKTAQAQEEQFVEEVADSPEFVDALAKHAAEELSRRRNSKK